MAQTRSLGRPSLLLGLVLVLTWVVLLAPAPVSLVPPAWPVVGVLGGLLLTATPRRAGLLAGLTAVGLAVVQLLHGTSLVLSVAFAAITALEALLVARLVTGGGRPEGLDTGWYVQPTLFADVDNSMRIAQEEIFGPVIVVIPYDTVDDAVRIANDSPYGLSGAVFTADPALGESVARRVRTGQIYVNDWGMCVTQPFGGFKQSGLGREGGPEGIGAFLETKMIQGI